ncbi:MAG: protein-L-isoaspartate O-methyltransferase [Rickettsiales bacterium]|nr:protein-L-isoaspartate O-methyltransferase [Rickettsiales bacterium]
MSQNSTSQQKNMRDGQLRTNSVHDQRIIDVIESVRREAFVPEAMQGSAYVDEHIALKNGRCTLEPLVFATLLGLADVMPHQKLLLIGASYGYAAAILSKLGASVTVVESDPALIEEARTRLQRENIQNVTLHHGPMPSGWPNHTYDVIFIDGGVQMIPPALLEQLHEGGRLVAIEVMPNPSSPNGVGCYVKIQRTENLFSSRRQGNAFVPVLPGFILKEGFSL